MIVDSHCHAWRYWPYEPAVPDPLSRGTAEQLLWEMDQNGVDRAFVVCARIDHNPDDNDYVYGAAQQYPDRLYTVADVDCMWTDTYHTPGATARLREAVAKYRLRGFTHYVRPDDDGSWFLGPEGTSFFESAAELKQIASLALPSNLQQMLRELAPRFPTVPFLCHHMAGARVDEPDRFADILRSGAIPNIHVKLSGFHYASKLGWEYPYPDCEPLVRGLYDAFGPERLHWGSDYPVVRKSMTYQQSLEAVRTHCSFIPSKEMDRILGDSLYDLIER